MKVIYGSKDNGVFERPMGIWLGNFDGLHIGHMALINTVIREAKLNDLDSMIYTFMKHPENILRKKLFTPQLTTVSKKIELLSETALEAVYLDEFDEEFSRMKPEHFIEQVLVGKLNMKLAVAGFDYRFGFRGQGDVHLLRKLGEKLGYQVIIIDPIKIGDSVVSSTLIRHHVAKGDMDTVFKLLGRHYSIAAEVKTGRKVGSRLGFPTANIHPEEYMALPNYGVYVTKTLIEGRLYESVTNIGIKPTFKDAGSLTVETHILDFNQNLYDQWIEVYFLHKIRGEKKFKDIGELKHQIDEDVAYTRKYFGHR